jgi:hypothetical protein
VLDPRGLTELFSVAEKLAPFVDGLVMTIGVGVGVGVSVVDGALADVSLAVAVVVGLGPV